MASEHTAKAFDSDLQELTRLVAEMGGLAERMIVESVDALIDGLRWFKIGYSWGGVASLAVSYRSATLSNPGRRVESAHLVRLSIGLESPADLIADLEAGLGRLRLA